MRRVGVVFGGQSVEHEVSVITAMQVMAALPAAGYVAVPLYIAKSGTWYTGDLLNRLDAFRDFDRVLRGAMAVTPRIDGAHPGRLDVVGGRRGILGRGSAAEISVDVVLPLVHGSHGEDGTLAGLCELWGVPYAGCGVAAAALSMDKSLAKRIFRAAGLPVLDDMVVERQHWLQDSPAAVSKIEHCFGYPVFVKPATLGSSIGVSPAGSARELRDAIDLALAYSDRVLVEPQMQDIVEINCAVLGSGDTVRASALEQPVVSGVLTYAEKYAGGKKAANAGMKGARRIVPAPIDVALAGRISRLAKDAFHAIGAAGVARVDFLVSPERGEVILNEINTVPGSLAFYLWEESGLPFAELLNSLIDLAFAADAERSGTTYSIDSWLLAGGIGGVKTGGSA